MTMTPDRFQRLLDSEIAAAPPAPLVASDLAVGRARLRRRRIVSASTAALAVVVVAAGVGLVTGRSHDRAVGPVAPSLPPSPSAAAVDAAVADCVAAMPSGPGFTGGRVVTTAASAYEVSVVYASDDDRHWASCSGGLLSGRAPLVQQYDSQITDGAGFAYSVGAGCPGSKPAGCRLYMFGATDRLDPAVTAVRFDLFDGTSTTVTTVDGYYAVDLLARLPGDQEWKVLANGMVVTTDYPEHPGPTRVTYLDAAGNAVAATVYDGSGSGRFDNEVPGLPLCEAAYPSMNGT